MGVYAENTEQAHENTGRQMKVSIRLKLSFYIQVSSPHRHSFREGSREFEHSAEAYNDECKGEEHKRGSRRVWSDAE